MANTWEIHTQSGIGSTAVSHALPQNQTIAKHNENVYLKILELSTLNSE